MLSAFLFNIAQKPLFPIIEWIAGSVLKSPFFEGYGGIGEVSPCPFLFTVTRLMLCGQKNAMLRKRDIPAMNVNCQYI